MSVVQKATTSDSEGEDTSLTLWVVEAAFVGWNSHCISGRTALRQISYIIPYALRNGRRETSMLIVCHIPARGCALTQEGEISGRSEKTEIRRLIGTWYSVEGGRASRAG